MRQRQWPLRRPSGAPACCSAASRMAGWILTIRFTPHDTTCSAAIAAAGAVSVGDAVVEIN